MLASAGAWRKEPQNVTGLALVPLQILHTSPISIRDSRNLHHGRNPVCSLYGHAGHEHGMSACGEPRCVLLTLPGLEPCCLLLWRCDVQRRHGLLRRKMRQQVRVNVCVEARMLTECSIATRIAYALILLVNSIVSWIMLTDWAMKKLSHLTLDYVDIKCLGEECYGYVAVQRINFALGFFHVLMALMLIGVQTSKDPRATIQNGFWLPKIFGWIAMIVLTFFIPNSFFIVWGNYFAMVGACLFLLIGLILLVDLAHNWAEYCQEKIETTESRVWTGMLVGSAMFMYLASFAMTVVMYIYFAKSGCGMNQAAITVS